ncbi:MAG: sigma-54 dependent transcriptional regulator [Candidatus Hydrogenedentota bacterium]
MKHKIQVVDDDKNIRELFKNVFSDEFEVILSEDGIKGLKDFEKELPELVLLDIRMPEMDGIIVLEKIKAIAPDTHVIMITAIKDTKTAIEAMKKGAYDYLIKPIDIEELKIQARRILEKINLEKEVKTLRETITEKYSLNKIIGKSQGMQKVFDMILKVKDNDSSVLIRGESGTGKELVARAIHFNGHRFNKPFIAVNAAAIPEQLLESELFGHEKGAFTGAINRRIGRFEQANEGTLFLDEIGNLKPDLQAKLLRVIQEREIERVGGDKPIAVDIRLICATSIDLEEAVKKGVFRQDLYFRVNVIPIELPPLRHKIEDLELLVEHFIKLMNQRFGLKITNIDEEGIKFMKKYSWPGNVRELEHMIERLFVVFGREKKLFTYADIKFILSRVEDISSQEGMFLPLGKTLNDASLLYIKSTYLTNNKSLKKTADILDINRKTLRNKLKVLGLIENEKEEEMIDDETA